MSEFIRFEADEGSNFASLCSLFEALKAFKAADIDSPPGPFEVLDEDGDCQLDPSKLHPLLSEAVLDNFDWTITDEREAELARLRQSMIISPTGSYLGARSSFSRVIDLICMGDYAMVSCAHTRAPLAELHIKAYGHPYGGINPLIALVEGFSFRVIDFDEGYGYEEAGA